MKKSKSKIMLFILIVLIIIFLSIPSANEVVIQELVTKRVYNFYLPFVSDQLPVTEKGVDIGGYDVSTIAKQMNSAGVTFVKVGDIIWADVEKIKGTYDWTVLNSLEKNLRTVQNLGIEPILNIQGSPSWAQKLLPGEVANPCRAIKESELDSYTKFVSEMIRHFPNIIYWEIWNEPDASSSAFGVTYWGFGCWGTDGFYNGGEYYARALKNVYPVIKSINPNAVVIAGGLMLDCSPELVSCTTSRFFRGVLSYGYNYFDWVNIHVYDYYTVGGYFNPNWGVVNIPSTGKKVDYIKNQFTSLGLKEKPIIITESGLLCGSDALPQNQPGELCDSSPNSLFEQTKASYLESSYNIAKSEEIRMYMWYSVFGWRNSGLFYNRKDTSGKYLVRPVYNTLKGLVP